MHESHSDGRRWAEVAGAWFGPVGRTSAAAASVLRKHPGLSLFPVLSLATGAVIATGALAAIRALSPVGSPGTVASFVLIGAIALILFVLTLGDAGLLCAADQLLSAGDGDSHRVLEVVLARWRVLLRCFWHDSGLQACALGGFALSLTVGLTGIGDAFVASSGLVTALMRGRGKASYLLVPVILLEDRGYEDGMARMTSLHAETWGAQSKRASTGLGLLATALFGPAALITLVLLALRAKPVSLDDPVLDAMLAWSALVWALTGAMRAIYQVALYRYAAAAVVVPPFDGADLAQVFHRGSD